MQTRKKVILYLSSYYSICPPDLCTSFVSGTPNKGLLNKYSSVDPCEGFYLEISNKSVTLLEKSETFRIKNNNSDVFRNKIIVLVDAYHNINERANQSFISTACL